MSEVFILLGGNVGDKYKIFNNTKRLIGERIGEITKLSSIYITEPWGFESDLFWNQALILNTRLEPTEVLLQTQSIEKEMGRIKTSVNYEARVIDIDILYFDDMILESSDLTIPHPRVAERKFALVPLNQIAPEKRDPVTGLTVSEMLLNCPDQLKVEIIN